jgi:hypothetical protein
MAENADNKIREARHKSKTGCFLLRRYRSIHQLAQRAMPSPVLVHPHQIGQTSPRLLRRQRIQNLRLKNPPL